MTRIWYGELDMLAALQDGQMSVSAARVYARHLKKWLGISSFTTDNPQIGASAS
jgi:hypothetical protein